MLQKKATSTLQLFSAQSNGTLEFEKHCITENRPCNFAITSNDHYLVAAIQFSNHIARYRIDLDTDELTPQD